MKNRKIQIDSIDIAILIAIVGLLTFAAYDYAIRTATMAELLSADRPNPNVVEFVERISDQPKPAVKIFLEADKSWNSEINP